MRFKSNNIFRMLLIICLLLTVALPAWAATTPLPFLISASSDDAEQDGLLGDVYTDSVDVPLGDYFTGMLFFPAIRRVQIPPLPFSQQSFFLFRVL